jgi:hypothetical protein
VPADVENLAERVDRDRRERERDLLALLLLLFWQTRQHVYSALRVGADPYRAAADVLNGAPHAGPGLAPRLAGQLAQAERAGYRRTLLVLPFGGAQGGPGTGTLVPTGTDWRQQAQQYVSQMLTTLYARLRQAIAGAAPNGPRGLQDAIRRAFAAGGYVDGTDSPWLLRTLAERFVNQAYQAGFAAGLMRPEVRDELTGFRYVATLDMRTSEICHAYHGVRLPAWHPWLQTHWPQLHWNCFLPGTVVSGSFVGGLKARYAGVAVEIETFRGHRLRVTANHPVMTGRGWQLACDLCEGDTLFTDALEVKLPVPLKVDDEERPARIEDVFQSLGLHARSVSEVSPLDLYGDGHAVEGKIDVVGADCGLVGELASHAAQALDYLSFVGRNAGRAALNRLGYLRSLLGGLGSAGSCGPSFPALAAHRVGVGLHSLPFGEFGFRATSERHAILAEQSSNHDVIAPAFIRELLNRVSGLVAFDHGRNVPADNYRVGPSRLDALRFQDSRNSVMLDVVLGRNGTRPLASPVSFGNLGGVCVRPLRCGPAAHLDTPAGEKLRGCVVSGAKFVNKLHESSTGRIAADKLIKVRRFDYSGHVYDLHSTTGWLMANGVVASNCRSVVIPLFGNFTPTPDADLPYVPVPQPGFGQAPLYFGGHVFSVGQAA